MNKIDISDRFAEMWRISRQDAGKSQEYMAKALGVSKKTIQNWEEGTSCPNQAKGFEWFNVLGLQPLPYYLQLLYPSFTGLEPNSSDQDIDKALTDLILSLPTDSKRKILYIANGLHGSSPAAVLNMIIADLNTPLRARLNIALTIISNYELSKNLGETSDYIQPDMELLKLAYERSFESVKNNQSHYSTVFKEDA